MAASHELAVSFKPLLVLAVASGLYSYVPEATAQDHASDPAASHAPAAAENHPENGGDAPTNNDADTAQVQPPVLIEEASAEYPAAALRDRIEGHVVLRLTIDAYGKVTEAQVMEPAGHGFDEAAKAAALRSRYQPARRGETPVASRVLTRIDFRLPVEAKLPKPVQPPATGALAGRILLPGEPAQGLAGVAVVVQSSDGGSERTESDAHGDFRITELTPGKRTLHVDAPGFEPVEIRTEVVANEVASVTARLQPALQAAPIEVMVRGTSDVDRLRQSAEAVTVIETDRAKRETADMGEVLGRTQGVGVRRGGGLGSGTRFSLNGLTDDQVRFFLDGVPLEFAGYPFGIANVPVNLIDRVEIYSGVVPIRFGADALGGAVNLATERKLHGTHGSASYELGSFDTHRVTLGARHLHEPSGFFTRIGGFFDYTKNDYPVDVEVPDERGRLSPATVYRFHDSYRARGLSAEVGLVQRPWAERLLMRGFVTDYDKDYQHNIVMTVPYGEVSYGEKSAGMNLRYEHDLGRGVSTSAVAGYAYTEGYFLDVSECVYDWFGRCVRERRVPGETDSRPHDQQSWDHSAFARINFEWRPKSTRALRLVVAPTYLTRRGDERRQSDPSARDPLTAKRKLLTLVNGAEFETDFFEDKLENILFIKQYAQLLDSEEPRPGGIFRERDRNTQRFGVGDGLRYRFVDWLYGKASYEWATRLPRPDEVFGDNAFIIANLELAPETSHNLNLGFTIDAEDTALGGWRTSAKGFWREADQLIVLLGNDRVQSYQNVYAARSVGVEAGAGWTSPGECLSLDGNLTHQEFRNTSSDGTFGDFEGDRIPNRPYLFANGSARLQFRRIVVAGDEVALSWTSRYVHEYFRGWESIGLREFKQTVDSQLVHSAGLSYVVESDVALFTSTLEVQNVTDEAVYDFFGVQRPGRASYAKLTAEF